ncbi:MAG: hypothetical protein WHT08_06155 [Bryobacteraceae bacterium]
MVAFDSTILSVLLFPDAKMQGVDFARERVQALIQELDAAREQILIPAPALCEVLVTEGTDPQTVLTELRANALIRIGEFDERAAVELAMRLREAARRGDPKEGLSITKSVMKFDRQIVAIALVQNARILYSDDAGVQRFAAGCSLPVKGIADLPVPPLQNDLPFEADDGKGSG